MSHGWYILVGQTPVEVDIVEAAEWFDNFDNRNVKQWKFGPLRVSTVFLGMDHSFLREGPPILFETMSFLAGAALWQTRCSTWMEAEEQHRHAVRYTKSMMWRHPLKMIQWTVEAIEHWMREWDIRFAGRYGKTRVLEELPC